MQYCKYSLYYLRVKQGGGSVRYKATSDKIAFLISDVNWVLKIVTAQPYCSHFTKIFSCLFPQHVSYCSVWAIIYSKLFDVLFLSTMLEQFVEVLPNYFLLTTFISSVVNACYFLFDNVPSVKLFLKISADLKCWKGKEQNKLIHMFLLFLGTSVAFMWQKTARVLRLGLLFAIMQLQI